VGQSTLGVKKVKYVTFTETALKIQRNYPAHKNSPDKDILIGIIYIQQIITEQ